MNKKQFSEILFSLTPELYRLAKIISLSDSQANQLTRETIDLVANYNLEYFEDVLAIAADAFHLETYKKSAYYQNLKIRFFKEVITLHSRKKKRQDEDLPLEFKAFFQLSTFQRSLLFLRLKIKLEWDQLASIFDIPTHQAMIDLEEARSEISQMKGIFLADYEVEKEQQKREKKYLYDAVDIFDKEHCRRSDMIPAYFNKDEIKDNNKFFNFEKHLNDCAICTPRYLSYKKWITEIDRQIPNIDVNQTLMIDIHKNILLMVESMPGHLFGMGVLADKIFQIKNFLSR